MKALPTSIIKYIIFYSVKCILLWLRIQSNYANKIKHNAKNELTHTKKRITIQKIRIKYTIKK